MPEAWMIYRGGAPHDGLSKIGAPPPWRKATAQTAPARPEREDVLAWYEHEKDRGAPFQATDEVRRAVNTALLLRRPLLLTGKPGVGKSTLISSVAYELRLGPVLHWPITSRTTVRNGLYDYDAVGRLYARQLGEASDDIGNFLRLGALGTALLPGRWPRALLIDEIDKGDLDLPNDLLTILEEGRFEIPELKRAGEGKIEVRVSDADEKVPVIDGKVQCEQFPFIVMTSNGEREFPAPFLRRCVRLTIPAPKTPADIERIVRAHMGAHLDPARQARLDEIVKRFLERASAQELATDQLMNAVFLTLDRTAKAGESMSAGEQDLVIDLVLKQLTTAQAT